jgi:L-gulonate 5-dehydrogenase
MTEYVLCRADQLAPIPDTMSFEAAAVVETLSIGAQAVHRGDVRRGDRVVVLGAGPIGLCCLIMARQRGASVLVSEPLPWRRSLAESLGAEVCVDLAAQSVADAVQGFTDGHGAHVVIDATGEITCAQFALTLVGQAARVVILSLCEEPLQIAPWELVRQELTVLGSRLTLTGFADLVAMAASGDAPLGRLVTHRYEFSQADRAFAAVCERPSGLVKAIVLPGA